MRDLRSLPKVELHVHLEGSIRPGTLAELAAANGAVLPDALREGRYAFRDFAHFIAQWTVAMRCLRRPEDFRRIAMEFCEDEAAQGVRYAEPFFSLPEHAENTGDWAGPIDGVLDGLAEGAERFGVRTRLVVDVIRGFPLEASERGMREAAARLDRGVVGIGLGGNEAHRPAAYAGVFRRAAEAGLRRVAHAGEAEGPGSVREAVEALGAERIGHGVRVLEDPGLVEELRERAVPFEVCPTSNVMTGVVPSLDRHPLAEMRAAGLVVTLNSDDPAMFGSDLLGEYEVARAVLGLGDEELAALARAGVEASFAGPREKAELSEAVAGWLDPP